MTSGTVAGGGGVEADRSRPRPQQRGGRARVDDRARRRAAQLRRACLGRRTRRARPREVGEHQRALVGGRGCARSTPRSPRRLQRALQLRVGRRSPAVEPSETISTSTVRSIGISGHGAARALRARRLEARGAHQCHGSHRRGATHVEARPSRSSIAATAASWRRQASAQMIAKPAAMPGICGARKARPPASSVNSASGHSRLSRIALGWCSGSVVRGLRAGQQARDRRVRLGAPAQPQPDRNRDQPPARPRPARAWCRISRRPRSR